MRRIGTREIEVNGKKIEYVVIEFDSNTQDLRNIAPEPDGEDLLDDDEDVFDSFVDASDSCYISDFISENASDNENASWERAAAVSEYVEDAISEGLVDTHNFDLYSAFAWGEFNYYEHIQYDNLNELCVLWMIENVIKGMQFALVVLTESEVNEEELMQEFLDKLSDAFDDYNGDNNDRFWDLENDAEEMVDDILTDITDDHEEDGVIFTRLEDEEDTDLEEQIQEWLDNHESEDE